MTPYAMEHVTDEDFRLFREIRLVVKELPDVELGIGSDGIPIPISCHTLTRALAEFFPVQVCDGYVQSIWMHSWLETRNGAIIDPYPVAMIGGPILVAVPSAPWEAFYRKASKPFPELHSELFLSHVERLTDVVRATIEALKLKVGV